MRYRALAVSAIIRWAENASRFLEGIGRSTQVAPENILILTAYTHHIEEYAKLSVVNKQSYAQHHGYAFQAHTTGFDPYRAPSWSKIRFIQQAFREYLYVFWSDADALIMNPEIRLENFIISGKDIHFTTVATPFSHIQCGNFFIKRSPFSRLFLFLVWNLKSFIENPVWEQAAVNYLLNRYTFRRIQVSPNRLFNSLFAVSGDMDPYRPGDFMVHFPGVKNRENLMKSFSVAATGFKECP